MTKRFLVLLLLLPLFFTCKKETKPVAVNLLTITNIVGNWELASYQTNFGIGVNASVTQYPCMAYNTMTFYIDSTAIQSYSGIDTCFITPSHLKSGGAQDYGVPGGGVVNSTWGLKGNVLHITYPGNPHIVSGTITSVNNQLQLTLRDTVPSGTNIYYITAVEVKQ